MVFSGQVPTSEERLKVMTSASPGERETAWGGKPATKSKGDRDAEAKDEKQNANTEPVLEVFIPITTMRARIGDLVVQMGKTRQVDVYELSAILLQLKSRDREGATEVLNEVLRLRHKSTDFRILEHDGSSPKDKNSQDKK